MQYKLADNELKIKERCLIGRGCSDDKFTISTGANSRITHRIRGKRLR